MTTAMKRNILCAILGFTGSMAVLHPDRAFRVAAALAFGLNAYRYVKEYLGARP